MYKRQLVLRPERTEPALRAALDAATAEARLDFIATVARAHADALPLVSAATTHVGPGAARAQRAEVLVDWSNCARRASGLERSHEPRDASSAALLAAAGAVGAKLTSSAVASKASAVAAASAGSTAVQAAASKALASKVAAPFVAKAASALGASASAATAAAAAGPGAAVAGAAVGLAADVALAKAIALARRPAFEADGRVEGGADVGEWAGGLGDALDGACDVWMNDAIQLTTARDADAPPPAAAAATPAEAPEDAPPPEGAPPPPRAGVD